MALTGLHTNWIKKSYTEDRDEEIKKAENRRLFDGNLAWLNAHVDEVEKSIAVGYGYDLKKNLGTLKTDLAGYVTANTDFNKVYNLINEYFNQGNPKKLDLKGLATEINKYFDFGTEAKAAEFLANRVDAIYESRVDSWLGYHMENSRERAALVSLSYNGGLGSKLKDAILNDNRAEAWFEIRYNTNGGESRSQGLANRRYNESYLFGLYDSGSSFTDDEAKEVLRMFTRNKDTILQYEHDYPPSVSGADGIIASTKPAADYRIANYGEGKTFGNVIVGSGLQSYAYLEKCSIAKIIAPNTDNLIFGENKINIIDGGTCVDVVYGGTGKDTIDGGAGDDILYGGAGDDILYGGAGNDTYVIKTGDGTDTIEDKEGDNTVIVNGKKLKYLIRQADGSGKSIDGKVKAIIEGPNNDLVLYDAVTGVKLAVLNENFQDGDFGIHLKDMPATPETTRTIVGDLTPIAGYDDLGNPVTDPGSPDPNKADLLFDSAGNDLIESGDTIYTGTGNDVVYAGVSVGRQIFRQQCVMS